MLGRGSWNGGTALAALSAQGGSSSGRRSPTGRTLSTKRAARPRLPPRTYSSRAVDGKRTRRIHVRDTSVYNSVMLGRRYMLC